MTNKTEKTEPVNPYTSYGMMGYIYSVIDKFPSIKDYVTVSGLSTATLFTPQTLSQLDGEISRNNGIIHNSYLLIDLINQYSIEVHNEPTKVYNQIVESIVHTRSIDNEGSVLSNEALDVYTVVDVNGFTELLNNNKVLVAIYLFILTTSIFENGQ